MANVAHVGVFSITSYKGLGRRRLLPPEGSAGETISQIIVPGPLQREPSGPCITRMTCINSSTFSAFGFGFCPGLAFGSNPVSDIHRKNLENLNQETVQLGSRGITSVDFTDNAVLLDALGHHF